MLTQTLPTLRTSHPTEPPPVSNHHHPPATPHATFPPTSPSPSLNPSSLPSSSPTSPTSDPRIPHLPPELWLHIFPSILSSNTSPEELTNLHLVCRAFHSLLTRHEASLVRDVLRTQTLRFPFLSLPAREEVNRPATQERHGAGGQKSGSEAGRTDGDARVVGSHVPLLAISKVGFPSPSPSSLSPDSASSSFSTFSDLWTLHRRLRSWEECEEVWRRCVSWGPEFAWAKDRWEGVHFWGMVELVRLGDVVGSGCSGVKGEALFQDGRDEHAHEHGEGTTPRYQPTVPPSSPPPSASSAWRRTAEPPPSPSLAAIASPASSSSQPASLTSALERHTARLTHLLALPAPSLGFLLFKLHTALRILRVLGPHPLRTTSIPSAHRRPWDSTTPQEIEMDEVWHDGNGVGLTRCEVEVAVEECLLGYGPEVLVGLVEGADGDGDRQGDGYGGERGQQQQQQRRRRQRRGRWAKSLFEAELQSLHSRQQPFPDGSPKPPTLIACLRRTFAEKTNVAFAETEAKMWEVLSSSEMGLDGDGLEKMGSVIGGGF
ncbi:hypothetical protein D0864_11581 [Hortaea werneckii]|uniref:F-box domain-containing protein n=1 Tax=Hortaea werneckii TaxID=91943 RepID=A0A3M7DSV3_HORWE|nr:hypothetical protein D0864_11581 [Hortaea werneckii]